MREEKRRLRPNATTSSSTTKPNRTTFLSDTKISVKCVVTWIVIFVAVVCTTNAQENNDHDDDDSTPEESPLTIVHAVEAGRVLLPCDVSAPEPTDETILVLFYQGPIGTPIYSIDGRNGPINRAPHWADENTLGNRAYFDMSSEPPGLVLQSVRDSDDNEYRCRVDFRSSPTRNVRIELNVIVPPKKIKILSEDGLEVSGVIGPYPVGASVSLVCQVDSGRPRPGVSWFHEGSLLDDVSEITRGELTSNTLTIPALTRHDLYRVLTCQASNSNLSVPVAAAVTLDMSFPPLDVRIIGSLESLSEGERYEIVCESSGSRPTATITWWKDGMLMTDTKSQVFQEGNVSRSTLYLTPSLADHDAYVSCRAKNPMVPAAVLEDSKKLNVHYTPRLSLAAGQNLDMEDIKEGDDVYFECGIKANPKVIRVQWFHNGEELVHNVTAGVIQSNQSLVLQKVNRRSSGQYTCSATNMHGLGKSNAVQLSVKFAPVCRPGQKVIYGGGKHEELNVTCSVEAHPEPTYFRWAFNSSSEIVDIPSSRFWVLGKGRSQASYTPRTHLDYGTLLCWANNEVGRQQQPCIFHVIHASAPDPVNNCTVDNVTSTGAAIRCQAGWDGGMEQTFMMRVSTRGHTRPHDKKKEAPRVLANTSTSPKPEFLLTGLEPGTEYVLTIMGVNKKGQSDAMRMAIYTLKDVAQKRTSPGTVNIALTPILAVLFGVLASILLMVIVIVLVVRSRQPRPRKPEVKMLYDKTGNSPSHPMRRPEDSLSQGDDHNPDIIPINDDHQVMELKPDYEIKAVGGVPGSVLSTSSEHLQQSSSQASPKQGSIKKEYLQGHEGSFYINPGTLLRQKGSMLPPREPDSSSLLMMGCPPLAASTPTSRNTTPTVNENSDRPEREKKRKPSLEPPREIYLPQEIEVSTSPWLPHGSKKGQRLKGRRSSEKSLLSCSPSSSFLGVHRSDSSRSEIFNRPEILKLVNRSNSSRSELNRPVFLKSIERSDSNRSDIPAVSKSVEMSESSRPDRPILFRSVQRLDSTRTDRPVISKPIQRSESSRSDRLTVSRSVQRSDSNKSDRLSVSGSVQRSDSNKSDRLTVSRSIQRSDSNQSDRLNVSKSVQRSDSSQSDRLNVSRSVQRSDSSQSERLNVSRSVQRSDSNLSDRLNVSRSVQRSDSNLSDRLNVSRSVQRSDSNQSDRLNVSKSVQRSDSNQSDRLSVSRSIQRSDSNRSESNSPLILRIHRSDSNRSEIEKPMKPVRRSSSTMSESNKPVAHRPVHRTDFVRSESARPAVQRSSTKESKRSSLRIDTSACSFAASREMRKLEKRRSLEAEDVTSPWFLNAPIIEEEWRCKETLVATSPWLQEPRRSGSLKTSEVEECIAPWPPLVTKKAEKIRIVCPLDAKVRIELKL